MISGLTRLSKRSMLATALFFLFGGSTATLLHSAPSATGQSWDWSIGEAGWNLVVVWFSLGVLQLASTAFVSLWVLDFLLHILPRLILDGYLHDAPLSLPANLPR